MLTTGGVPARQFKAIKGGETMQYPGVTVEAVLGHHNVIATDPANSNVVFVNTDIESNLITKKPDGSPKFDEWLWENDSSGKTPTWTRAVDGGGDPVGPAGQTPRQPGTLLQAAGQHRLPQAGPASAPARL